MNIYSLLNAYPLDPKKVKVLLIKQEKQNKDIVLTLGIPQPTISKYINGKGRNPKIQQAIADFLGVPLDSIIQKENGRRPKRAA